MRGLDDESDSGERHSSSMASVDDTVTNGVCVRHKGPLRLLQGLQLCRGAWGPGDPWDRHSAHAALWGRPPGSFLVVDDSSSQNKLLCVSVDGQDKTVLDFSILLTGTALQLSTSRLTFCDLLQLVTFYTLSRDVLPLCLLVPSWVCSLTKQPSHLLPQLGPKAWLCPSTDLQPVVMTPGTTDSQDTVMCSIQLTTSSGALCIINPLYLHEHGDDWLTYTSASPQPASYPDLKRDRRMSTARPCVGAGLKKGGVSLDKPSNSSDQSGGAVQSPVSPVTTEGVVLRRSSCSTTPDPVRRESAESLGPVPQSPHRVSWVEDKFWLNPPPSPSLLQPPCLELDSLSISSIEEEPEAESPSQLQHLSRLPLADKVKNRLSAVGQALGSLMSPRRRLSKRVQELSERRGGAFAEAVRGFVEQMMKLSAVPSGISVDVLQDVRVSLTALKETLYDYTEIQSITDTLTELPDVELDALLELALHKVALKPIYTHLYVGMKTARQADGSLRRLEANRDTLAGHSLEELEGTAGAGVPDAITMEKIQQHWNTMHQAYSPSKKVDTLLKVCKNVYHSMSANVRPGVVFGADDFLPCLTWVLVRSDVATLQTDTDYMMELLDPSQLQGESGYYLTSLYAALFYISSYRPRLAARHLSAEAHKSLNQWHRRRTLHCNQSRRSRNRRTIRRHGRGEGPSKSNKEAGESSSNESGESGEVTKTRLAEDLSVVGEEEEEEGQPMEDQKKMNNQEP
ncbi:ras and Rab interactor 2 isoform X2 [Electrophorus electricus]|uniref:ras and Rab interactor 2 isoform X2 n=1 Tax=Electrophorus electricus TaxID=8005 RepID=UPI0015D09DC2|nr:ras and Rab interactor 2 isoform X2 [Electrophorus electricus]